MIRRFNRYELKYLIHATEHRAIVKDLVHYMVPDAHGDSDGYYRVNSLYYDSRYLDCYRSKMDGLLFRRKLRLRVYPGTDVTKVDTGFVEIKQRINKTVQKRRLVLSLQDAEELCAGHLDLDGLDELDHAAASEMTYMVKAMTLRPTAMVSYRRQAFMGSRFEPGMRVTFDMQLQGRMRSLEVRNTARNHYFMPHDWFVMEVKVNDRIPTWMIALLAKHQCQMQRVSKYCAVVANNTKRMDAALQSKENYYG
jgi:SPX domain protein involved in polyphosphate accumulation